MPATAPETPTTFLDPLLAHEALPLDGRFYPLGFALDIRTNSDQVLAAARRSWPHESRSFPDPPLRLSIGVGGDAGETETPPPVFRSRGHLFSILSGIDDFLVCDFRTGSGFGWIRPSTVSDAPFFRYHFLEALVLSMLSQLHFASVHGAAVVRSGCGVVLCGESSAGKSSLAYACARAGWTLVSDDATYLLRNRIKPFAVGNSHALRFRPDAPLLFPELRGLSVATRPNGKPGIEVLTRDLPGVHTAPGAPVHHVVFLHRSERGEAHFRACSREDALSRLAPASPYGQEDVGTAQLVTYERLTRLPRWCLHYSDLDDAVGCLEQLVNPGA